MTFSSSALESLMPHYAALDVSNAETAIHVLDETGRTVWRGKRPSDPEALATALRRHALELVRVGLETGFLTPWLYTASRDAACQSCASRRGMPGRQRRCNATRPTRTTPRRWSSSCARAGTGRRGSRVSQLMPCAIFSAPGRS